MAYAKVMKMHTKVQIMINMYQYRKKPSDEQIRKLQKKLRRKSMSLEAIAEALVQGATIRCGILEGGIKAHNWVCQQLFALNFNDGTTTETVHKRAVALGILPVFMYTTFSHTKENPKFCAVFCMNEEITDGNERDLIQATLIGLFDGADQWCNNRDRIFLGGNGEEVIFADYGKRICIEELLCYWRDDFVSYLPGTYGSETEEQHLKEEKNASYPQIKKQIRDTAKFNIKCLDRCYEERVWVKGTHRERFVFIYYNVAKILFGGIKAAEMIKGKVAGMEEPLDEEKVNDAIKHTDDHKEYKRRHIDGIFTYTPARIIEVLELTEEEADKYGFYEKQKKDKRHKDNQNKACLRDKKIAELFLVEGYGYEKIADIITKDYPELLIKNKEMTKSTVRYTLKRLGVLGQRGNSEVLKEVDFELRKRYARVLTFTERSFAAKDEVFCVEYVTSMCKDLHRRHMAAKGCSRPNNVDFVDLLRSGVDVNLQGGAGSGKSSYLKTFYASLTPEEKKRTCIVTPTGVASDNLGGIAHTIHSTFNLECGILSRDEEVNVPGNLRNIDRIVIDEISMVRADVFSYVIRCVKKIEEYKGSKIQIIVIGDFSQLPPVVADEERPAYEEFFGKEIYAFETPEWEDIQFTKVVIYENRRVIHGPLTEAFINACEAIRFGSVDALIWINQTLSHVEDEDAVYLCPTRRMVDYYNAKYIEKFKIRKVYRAKGNRVVDGPEESLELAVGMRVMTLTNKGTYKNGSVGIIKELRKDTVVVYFEKTKKEYVVRYEEFSDGKNSMKQLPIAVAGAMTVNKAQGLTLEAVNIVPGFFSPGALYTALTRCKDVDKIHIVGMLKKRDLQVDTKALELCVEQ